MKTLSKQFVSGEAGYSVTPLTYTQIARDGLFAVYERSLDGRVKDYETIKIRVIKAGTKIFNQVTTEDEERYAATSSWGRSAWSYGNKTAALNKLNELVKGMVKVEDEEDVDSEEVTSVSSTPKRRGRVAAVRPTVVYPKTEFTMKELVTVNKEGWTQPTLYIKLQQDITSSIVKEVGRRSNGGGRGKPSVVYSLMESLVD
jgi:hypothetical protein